MAKIAFVSTNKSAWGGSEYLWYLSAIRCAEMGHAVTAGVPRWKNVPSEIDELRKKGISVNFTTDVSGFKKAFNRVLPAGMQMSYSEDGYRFLTEQKPALTVINQGGNWGGTGLMLFCKRNRLKYVTIAQAANEAKWPDDATSVLLAEGLDGAVMNYYVSKANVALTEKQAAGRIRNARVVFNPFNVDYGFNEPYPGTGNGFRIANVARHEIFPKGQDILFEVAGRKKWRERDLGIRLYGKGEHSGNVRRLIEYYGLKNVTVEGHVNPSEIWKQNHALILSSRYEGLPLALVEAMLCRRTPIVTAVSGNPEVVEDNVSGFLASAAHPDFLDEALERAWSRRHEWEEIGKKAGESIRGMVPPDPVGHFCDELAKTGAI